MFKVVTKTAEIIITKRGTALDHKESGDDRSVIVAAKVNAEIRTAIRIIYLDTVNV